MRQSKDDYHSHIYVQVCSVPSKKICQSLVNKIKDLSTKRLEIAFYGFKGVTESSTKILLHHHENPHHSDPLHTCQLTS